MRGFETDAGDEPASGCEVRVVGGSVDGAQVGLADHADLDLERGDEGGQRRCTDRVGDQGPSPTVATTIAVKMGLRTEPNTPSVTRSVRVDRSTPMRHESPMASWATSVKATPPTPSVNPAAAAQVVSRA